MILRKPSASHWVQNMLPDLYSPSSAVLLSGWMTTELSMTKLSLSGCRVRQSSLS